MLVVASMELLGQDGHDHVVGHAAAIDIRLIGDLHPDPVCAMAQD